MPSLAPSGGDDTAALQALFDRGGNIDLTDPLATFRISAPLFYVSNSYHRYGSKFVFDKPGGTWPNTFLLGGKGFLINPRPRLTNITLDFSYGGRFISPSAKTLTSAGGQHGIGITFTENFKLIDPWVEGDDNRNLFCILVRESFNGEIIRGYLSHRTQYQGADGVHFVGNCHDVLVDGLATASADDSSSQTLELASEQNRTIERITYRNCLLRNFGHSSVKLKLINGVGDGSIIRDIAYDNCDMVTTPGFYGAGTPVWCVNQNPAALVERISITGGRLRVSLPNLKQLIGGPLITLERIKDFSLVGTKIEHFTRQLVDATDCPGLVFNPSSVQVVPRVMPIPSQPLALVRLRNCPGYTVDTSKLAPVYPGQTIVSST